MRHRHMPLAHSCGGAKDDSGAGTTFCTPQLCLPGTNWQQFEHSLSLIALCYLRFSFGIKRCGVEFIRGLSRNDATMAYLKRCIGEMQESH